MTAKSRRTNNGEVDAVGSLQVLLQAIHVVEDSAEEERFHDTLDDERVIGRVALGALRGADNETGDTGGAHCLDHRHDVRVVEVTLAGECFYDWGTGEIQEILFVRTGDHFRDNMEI